MLESYTMTTTRISPGPMNCLHFNGYLRQHTLLFAAWIVFSCARIGSSKAPRYHGGRTIDDLDGIFEIIRETHASASADGSKWSDAVDTWIGSIGEDNLGYLLGTRGSDYKSSLTRESIWNLWNGLRTSTRELVVRKLYPLLISGHSNGDEWRIHCADAHKLCMEDTNCYWKYANFISSCTEDDLHVFGGFAQGESFDNHEDDSLNRHSHPRRPKHGFDKHVEKHVRVTASRRNVKRDVFAVEKRIRKERRKSKNNRRKNRQKSIFWMGQHLKRRHIHSKTDEMLRYFSMETKSNRCSSKCVSSLIMLNETVYGTLLAHCDCRTKSMPLEYKNSESADESDDGARNYFKNWEKTCSLHQHAAQSCRPRIFSGITGVIGCTAARIKCEKEPNCVDAQGEFLSRCSQVINDLRCTHACRESVRRLRNATTHYDTCVCDGSEGPTCRQIRNRVIELCDVRFSDKANRTKGNLRHKKDQSLTEKPSSKKSHNNLYSSKKLRTQLKQNADNSVVGPAVVSRWIAISLILNLAHVILTFITACGRQNLDR